MSLAGGTFLAGGMSLVKVNVFCGTERLQRGEYFGGDERLWRGRMSSVVWNFFGMEADNLCNLDGMIGGLRDPIVINYLTQFRRVYYDLILSHLKR